MKITIAILLFLKLSFSASRSHSLPRTKPLLPSPHPTPTRLAPLTPRHTSPPKPALPLLITKNILPSPYPTPTFLTPPAPRRTRPPKPALPLLIAKNILPSPHPTPTPHTPTHPDAPARQNRRHSSPSYRRPSFQFGHLGTCLFCPFFGHFKHVPMCPKLQDISLSFASFLFLSQIFPRACDFP